MLWALDLHSLRTLQFAGMSDPSSQRRLLETTGSALATLEFRLALLHAGVGALVGVLAAVALERRSSRRIVAAGVGAAATLVLHTLALFAMVGRYPQLYADRWWLGGGPLATLQRVLTHVIGPRPFEIVLAALLLTLAAGAGVRIARAAASARLLTARRLVPAALAVLAVAVAGFGSGHAERAGASERPPNVLILASDSLRTDRLESPSVMPFTASLVPQGMLFRFAFTPIARTFPSWVSMLTGTEPRAHGVRTMFPRVEDLAGTRTTLFSALRDAGYRTFVVSDFAGDIFPRFDAGFERVDAPTLTADTLARATVLAGHTWSLPFLQWGAFRRLLPEWRNLASLSDPEWVVDRTLRQVDASADRPFAGLVFFSTSHFPYPAPYPSYLRGAGGYRGPYLYHAPPTRAGRRLEGADVEQVQARYDGALSAIDSATGRLWAELRRRGEIGRTVFVVTGDHGEELYETEGIAGHGDTLTPSAQAVPILIGGPGVPAGRRSDAQVRLHDVPATVLDILEPGRERRFGDGVSLLADGAARPICVQTGIWFWPDLPAGLEGRRLQYPGISALLEMDTRTRQLVLQERVEALVESAKDRGIVLGRRLWHQRLTPRGLVVEEQEFPSVEPFQPQADLAALFQEQCVARDPRLARLFGAVVFVPRGGAAGSDPSAEEPAECTSCGLGR
jgi:arylsulfatase A-like enzyme